MGPLFFVVLNAGWGVRDALVEGKRGSFLSVIVHSVRNNIVPHTATPCCLISARADIAIPSMGVKYIRFQRMGSPNLCPNLPRNLLQRRKFGKGFYSTAPDALTGKICGMLPVHCTMYCVRSEVHTRSAVVRITRKHGLVQARGVR